MFGFHPVTQAWLEESLGPPTAVQAAGWPVTGVGASALLIAPTGSGKTLAAFLQSIDALLREPGEGVRVLYVSPLKALVYDIERNLKRPLAGLTAMAARMGVPVHTPRVGVRTGDTDPRARRALRKHPPDLLVTTPESLFLILTSGAREALRSVQTVIIDEVHVLAPTRRGAHLALSLERLSALTRREPQRIGLSATVRPAEEAARWLGGDRPVTVVNCAGPPRLDLRVEVPVADLARPLDRPGAPDTPQPQDRSVWPALHERLLQLIRAHTTTLVFVNSRGLCERLARDLNALAGEELVASHHGSLSHARRSTVESALKAGELPALVATSSLELGIDMGSIDLVVCVEAPASVSSGLQRVGRAGHAVGARSEGVLLPKHRLDVVQCAVVGAEMRAGRIEAMKVPQNPLDVLAQQLVAICAEGEHEVEALLAMVRRAAPYQSLTRGAMDATLKMLSGGYPASAVLRLPPRLSWDRVTDRVRGRKGAGSIAALNAGTIPDRGLFGVHLGERGPRVGELDEEMVFESRPGDVFVLGSSSWRVEEIRQDRVIATPAPGRPGRMPFWKGEGPGRPVELGRALGAFLGEAEFCDSDAARAALMKRFCMDENALSNVLSIVNEQKNVSVLPTDRRVVLEHYRDDLGELRVNLLTPFGRRVHTPWAMALEAALGRRTGVLIRSVTTDDGISLRLVEPERGDEVLAALTPELLLPDPALLEELILPQVRHAPLFAALFREAAGRALLMPRTTPRRRRPLWAQRLRAQDLLAAVSEFPDFPVLLEVWREALMDIFDLDGLRGLLRDLRSGEVALVNARTRGPSPFSRGLDMTLVADSMYEGDKTAADRKALAMSLDRDLLRELMGEPPLGDLVEPERFQAIEEELQGLVPATRARDADGLHDLLRVLGHLDDAALEDRCAGDAAAWCATLLAEGRVARASVAGELCWIAAENASLYAAVLGSGPAEEGGDAPARLAGLRTRSIGPFSTEELAEWMGLGPALVRTILDRMEERGEVQRLRVGGEPRWCDSRVLLRARRQGAEAARAAVQAVDAAAYARFLCGSLGRGAPAEEGLEAALDPLRGLALPLTELDRHLLPARLRGYQPRLLDALCLQGGWTWMGAGEGRVRLAPRDEAALLFPRPGESAPNTRGEAVLAALEAGGPAFTIELQGRTGFSTGELTEVLGELAGAGLVHNDALTPLREPTQRRVVRGRGAVSVGGRWARTAPIFSPAPNPTERALALARAVLDRWGLISAPILAWEEAPGAEVRAVAREWEARGELMRGYFVEGLGGVQWAAPETVERLRAAREPDGRALVLSALDPANPYGAVLPWPEGTALRRTAGTRLVLVDGAPVLGLVGDALSVLGAVDPRAVQALARAPDPTGQSVEIATVDGEAAARSTLAPLLQEAGFAREGARMRLRRL